jgi:ribosomal protein S18 acetylase RimI-like enzyme
MLLPKYTRYTIEPLDQSHTDFVKEIVYQAIYTPHGQSRPTREILNNADIKKYYEAWGRGGDFGFLLIQHPSELPVGGAFVRLYPKAKAGYGFIAEDIPELNLALLPDHRGHGHGTKLLKTLIKKVKAEGYTGISLSVDATNPALRLYQKLGFKLVSSKGNPTMLLDFDENHCWLQTMTY